MRRHRHHRAVAVVGQHVVGGPDRQALAVDRVDGVAVQENPGLGAISVLTLDLGLLLHGLEVVPEGALHIRRRPGCQLCSQIAVGCDHHERCAVQRVGARGKDRDLLVATLDLEVDVGAH